VKGLKDHTKHIVNSRQNVVRTEPFQRCEETGRSKRGTYIREFAASIKASRLHLQGPSVDPVGNEIPLFVPRMPHSLCLIISIPERFLFTPFSKKLDHHKM
jgi:hypothetical protein